MRSMESNQSKIILRFVSKCVKILLTWLLKRPKVTVNEPKMSRNGRKLVKESLDMLMNK